MFQYTVIADRLRTVRWSNDSYTQLVWFSCTEGCLKFDENHHKIDKKTGLNKRNKCKFKWDGV